MSTPPNRAQHDAVHPSRLWGMSEFEEFFVVDRARWPHEEECPNSNNQDREKPLILDLRLQVLYLEGSKSLRPTLPCDQISEDQIDRISIGVEFLSLARQIAVFAPVDLVEERRISLSVARVLEKMMCDLV